MEVVRAEPGDEVLVVTRWRDREAFDACCAARSSVHHPL